MLCQTQNRLVLLAVALGLVMIISSCSSNVKPSDVVGLYTCSVEQTIESNNDFFMPFGKNTWHGDVSIGPFTGGGKNKYVIGSESDSFMISSGMVIEMKNGKFKGKMVRDYPLFGKLVYTIEGEVSGETLKYKYVAFIEGAGDDGKATEIGIGKKFKLF